VQHEAAVVGEAIGGEGCFGEGGGTEGFYWVGVELRCDFSIRFFLLFLFSLLFMRFLLSEFFIQVYFYGDVGWGGT
jgi:hypothetical protein